MIESWHGIDMPPLAVPKVFAQLIANSDKALSAFGFSNNSVTFYFEDDSWYKTQLYVDKYPDVDRIWQKLDGTHMPFNADIFDAIAQVTSFMSEDRFIRILADRVCTHDVEGVGATVMLPTGFSECWYAKPEQFLACRWATGARHCDNMLFMQGASIRAVMVGRAHVGNA
jgi:hypothetical protein